MSDNAADRVAPLFEAAERHGARATDIVDEVIVVRFDRGCPDARRFLDELPDSITSHVRHDDMFTRVVLLLPEDDPVGPDDPNGPNGPVV